ncbi:MAG: Mut7-C RNAse domain-containing protein [Candidatus Heimdallarchaeaceae archaeon]
MHKFYTDAMFGKLSRFLRFLGYDTLYRRTESVEEMLEVSKKNDRIVLTSSQSVDSLCIKRQIRSVHLTSIEISDQLRNIKSIFDIIITFPPDNSRCSMCNGTLTSRNKSEVQDRIPEGTALHYDDFWECDTCAKIFWLGSHWEDIKSTIENL